MGMWVFLVTEIMFFGGLFTSYVVYRALYPAAFAVASQALDITLGTINMALAMSSLVRLHYSTERAARCLAVDVQGDCSSGAIDAYAKSLDPIGGLSDLTFTYDAAATCGKKVDGSGTFEVLTGVGSISVPVTASACYPVS